MKVIKEITLAAVLFALSVVAAAQCKIEGSGAARSLTLGGRPFIILGGELGNSTASSDEEVEAVFPKLKAMGLNTVLAPAYWDLLEQLRDNLCTVVFHLGRFFLLSHGAAPSHTHPCHTGL